MSKDTKPIEVPASVAKAYQDASAEKQKRAERAMAAVLISEKEGSSQLKEMIGAGTRLYESPEQVDDEIRKQREEWDY
jgi:glycine cleavage system pyridoxal-binding protein P